MTTNQLTADDEEQLALDIAERTVAEIAVAEARMTQARTRLDHLMLEILPALTDEERAEMWHATAHVVLYLRGIEGGEFEASEKFWTAMQEIQRDSRRPPYVALHLDEQMIFGFAQAWVAASLPDLDDEERAVMVQLLLVPPPPETPADIDRRRAERRAERASAGMLEAKAIGSDEIVYKALL